MTYIEFLIVFAIFAGAAAYLSGRDLRRYKDDDPLIAERMFRHQGRVSFIYVSIVIGNPLFADLFGHAGIDIPVPDMPLFQKVAIDMGLILVCFCADHFQKRAVLNQTWNLFEALIHTASFFFAMNGFRIIAALAPSIVLASDTCMWGVAGVLSLLLVVWCCFYAWVLPRLMINASEIEPEIRRSFADIIEGANAPEPRIHAIHTDKSGYCNAFATPSLFSPTVMITKSLLKKFDPDEIRAIFAHEIAHLEEYPRKRLLVLSLVEYALVVAGCLCVPILKSLNAPYIDYVPVVWILIVVVHMVLRVRKQQKSEHCSDIRAAELSGNIDATINALIRVHTCNLTPRRTDMEFEANSTHPSLAKRIRAIRQHFNRHEKQDSDGGPKKTLVINLEKEIDGYNRVLVGGTRLTLLFIEDRADTCANVFIEDDSDRIGAMLDTAGKQSRIAYSQIAELRVKIKRKKYALRIIEKTGFKIDIPIRRQDLELIQTTLDTVDVQIPQFAEPMPAGLNISGLLGLICGFAVFMLCDDLNYQFAGSLVLFCFCLLNFWTRTPATMAGVAGACFGFVLHGVSVLLPDVMALGRASAILTFAGLIGVFHFYLARHQAGRKIPGDESDSGKTGMILTGCGLILLIPHIIRLVSEFETMLLYSAAGNTRWIFILLFSAGCILVVSKSRGLRSAGWLVVALALVPPIFGSEWFLCNHAGDCWAEHRQKPTFEHIPFVPRWTVTMDDYFWKFAVSPNGRYVLFEGDNYDREGNCLLYTKDGKAGDCKTSLSAFTDDSHLLVLAKKAETGYDLTLKALPDLDAQWQTGISDLAVDYETTLAATPDRWRIISQDDRGNPKRYAGAVFEDEFNVKQWKKKKRHSYEPMHVGEGDYALSCSIKGGPGFRPFHGYLFFANAVYNINAYEFRSLGKKSEIGVSTMYTSVYLPPPGCPEILVRAVSNTRAYLWLVNTETADRLFVGTCKPHDTIDWNGEWIVLVDDQSVLLMNPGSGRNFRIDLPHTPDYPSVSIGRTVVAVAANNRESDDGKTVVWVLGIPE